MGKPEIKGGDLHDARKLAGLTQQEAAELMLTSIDTWQNWEQDRFSVHLATYELFLIQTGQFQALKPTHDGDTIRLRLKLKSGRVIEIPLRQAAAVGLAEAQA